MTTDEAPLRHTCLHSRHVALGARMMPFAGYDMPVEYSGIEDEHRAVRTACGVFDVSHMGEISVEGPDAGRLVSLLFTNDTRGMAPGKALYGMMLYPDGGVVDDLLVYKTERGGFLLVVNAANAAKDWEWVTAHSGGMDVALRDAGDDYGQLAVQGPLAERVMEETLALPCAGMAFYTARRMGEALVSRTGYTGEDGFEVYAPPALTQELWDRLMADKRCKPCGLGCRDTLRFEVGLPLYGDELSPSITPLMAGLGGFCPLDRADFIGRGALLRQKAEGPARRLVGLELEAKAIARHGYPVLLGGEAVGEVTTGYRSPSTGRSVCMALVESRCARPGTELSVRVRKREFAARVVPRRFYDKHYKK